MNQLVVPEDYTLRKFYEYAGYPKHKKIANIYEGGCPTCMEGHSWGRKRRLYFIPKENIICCHNCGWYSQPLKWIMEVSHMSREEIIYELDTGDYKYTNITHSSPIGSVKEEPRAIETLPKDCINLLDGTQIEHYKDDTYVQLALSVIKARKLDTATNRPKAFYISLSDYLHKNRLIIPFYDINNKIVHYQSRGITMKDLKERPKYLSKLNSPKSLFNFNNIKPDADFVYLLEGPLDSCFLKNSVAVAGINESGQSLLTKLQQQMLLSKSLCDKVWVLDNQWIDEASYTKTRDIIKSGAPIFIWPTEFKQFKDLNDICVALNITEINEPFIQRNIFRGLSAQIAFSRIKSSRL